MNEKLLHYYNEELLAFKKLSNDFAKQYPKIASRLNLDNADLIDPYVERLLEGVSFLTARTQLKLDAEYPKFVKRILSVVYPQLLKPVPASCIATFTVSDYNMNVLNYLKREQRLSSLKIESLNIPSHCEFSVTKDLPLTPLKVESVTYDEKVNWLPNHFFKSSKSNDLFSSFKIDFSIKTSAEVSSLVPDDLSIYLGNDFIKSSHLLYLMANCCEKVVLHSYDNPKLWSYELDSNPIQEGFSENESLVFSLDKNISFLRVIQEFIQLPEKFNFIKQKGVNKALMKAERDGYIPLSGEQMEEVITQKGVNKKNINFKKRYFSITYIFNQTSKLCQEFSEEEISIHAVPLVNLFKKSGVRFQINDKYDDIHVVADKTQPLNYEIHTIDKVRAFDLYNNKKTEYLPVYKIHSKVDNNKLQEHAFFTTNRFKRKEIKNLELNDKRSIYDGSEVFISLMTNLESENDIHQLSVESWCTNRGLAQMIPRSKDSDFLIDSALPIQSVNIFSLLKRAKPTPQGEKSLWHLLNLLNLSFLSLSNSGDPNITIHLKELLLSFPHEKDDIFCQFVNAIVDVKIRLEKKLIRYADAVGAGLVRGMGIHIVFDEAEMGGMHPFIFGSIINKYLSQSATINSFVQLSIDTLQSNDVICWEAEMGGKSLL